jgi:hypothetical protein
MMGSKRRRKKMVTQMMRVHKDELASHGGTVILPKGVEI